MIYIASTGVIQLHPCTFAIGTKKKPYTTAVAQRDDDYTPDLDACTEQDQMPWLVPSAMDLQRSKERGKGRFLRWQRTGIPRIYCPCEGESR